ncbi:MAG: NAD(P)-dependent oxidoreductase [Rothia sp. (in: high G+C Gram-positive bacteria)]|uniref:precorrin-2 dehydrogenase/sirohydrochlorin ferrochelatase family protein n=1 Tax=Rothia sp. (in: high G+C Gram-positive bacteria) TaxID=1885016 RepID=UPI0026DEFF0D|nr:NAD(P)-dependent oxidoreductase [Rothia sp. (in: high G+C Gram-positive bacteria)]MDO5751170.1 NAD(P)-dependent oxidoreductase [Rothia sp. (in: high G+C Gram-positive bacteria)]
MLPIMVNTNHLPVLIVGAGKVAARRARILWENGAQLTVVAPKLGKAMGKLLLEDIEAHPEGAHRIRYLGRSFDSTDVRGFALILAHATESVNEKVALASAKYAKLCLVGGVPEHSGFWMMAHENIQASERLNTLLSEVDNSDASTPELTVAVSSHGYPKRSRAVLNTLSDYIQNY